MDSRGLVWTRGGIGSTPQNHYLTTRWCKKKSSPNPSPHLSPHQFTIDFVRFEDSPRLGLYKIKKESTRGDGLKAITNIVLGTRYPNGLHTKQFLVNLARTFVTPLYYMKAHKHQPTIKMNWRARDWWSWRHPWCRWRGCARQHNIRIWYAMVCN